MFPNELWLHVFDELDTPADLAAVVRTNKRFKALGTRILYRHVVWSDPLKFIKNYSFLQQNPGPGIATVVRALTLGVSTAISHFDRIEQISRARAIVHLTGDITLLHRPSRAHEARILDEIGIASPVELLASDDVTLALYNYAITFSNLRDLTFNSMVLPDSFYEFVHSFPALDKLAIENCTPPFRPHPTHLHPRDLPITELSITGLRRDPRDLRAFGEGKYLRVIRFDWTCYIYKHFCDPPLPPPLPHNWVPGFVTALPPGAPIPPLHTLQPPFANPPPLLVLPAQRDPPVPSPHIHTIDARFPTQKSWQSYVSEPHDRLINPFTDFLLKCPRIANLRIRNHLPWLRLPNTALPNLASYQGPLTTIKTVVSSPRRLQHLSFREPAAGLPALEKAFKEIEASGACADLETLSVFIGWWDDEILYAVLHHFSGLKRLEIMYKEGDPTEEMVLGMGAHFFGMMPRLWSVRVFKVMPPGVETVRTIAESLSARGYPHRTIQLALGELVPERSDFDEAEFEGAGPGTPSGSSLSRVGWSIPAEESEEDILKELIHAWNRYCPALREVQLKAGHVWRRASPNDVWTQRPTKVSRVRNAGFEDV